MFPFATTDSDGTPHKTATLALCSPRAPPRMEDRHALHITVGVDIYWTYGAFGKPEAVLNVTGATGAPSTPSRGSDSRARPDLGTSSGIEHSLCARE